MFSFARKTMLIFFSPVTFVWLKNPLAFDYDTRKSLIAGVDKELQNVTKCHCAVEEEGKRQKRLSFLYNRSFKKSSWKKNKTRGQVIFFTLNGKMQRPKSKRVYKDSWKWRRDKTWSRANVFSWRFTFYRTTASLGRERREKTGLLSNLVKKIRIRKERDL